jgi:hypothetical protein
MDFLHSLTARLSSSQTWKFNCHARICREGLTFDPEEALAFLSKYCKWAVVTLASKGCLAKHGKQVRLMPSMRQP